MKIVGFEKNDFIPKDSTVEIKGYTVFVARDITPERGKGVSVERLYISEQRLARSNFDIQSAVGKEVKVYYNRFGKVDTIAFL